MTDDEGNLALDWDDEVIAKACVAGKKETAAAEAPAEPRPAEGASAGTQPAESSSPEGAAS
jgi:hypothetical protein